MLFYDLIFINIPILFNKYIKKSSYQDFWDEGINSTNNCSSLKILWIKKLHSKKFKSRNRFGKCGKKNRFSLDQNNAHYTHIYD